MVIALKHENENKQICKNEPKKQNKNNYFVLLK